jgi:SpoIID/LytB domain protein
MVGRSLPLEYAVMLGRTLAGTTRKARRALGLVGVSALVLGGLLGSSAPAAIGSIATDDTFIVSAAGTLDIAGHGWGHGHGMSQWGAAGAATKGLSYSQILSFYYPGTASANIGDPTVKVYLASQYAINSDNIHILDPGTIVLYDEKTKKTFSFASTADWRVVASSSTFSLEVASGGVWVTKVRALGPIHVDTTRSTNHVSYPVDRTYTGWLRMVLNSSSSFQTIANVGMQSYLDGVVPSESISSWPAAALQAQAVAARSYAAYHFANPRSSNYHVYDTTTDQVFGGVTAAVASTNAAVAATSGVVRTYGGAAILAQFSSSNGGWATDGGEPYLPAHSDPYDGVLPNSVHSWTARVPASTLEAKYPSIGNLLQLKVTQRDGHGDWGGRVLAVTLVGSSGSVAVTGADIYSAYSWPTHSTGLRSTWFQVVPPAADVSGTGISALLTGLPGRSVSGQAGAGALAVIPGSTSGATSSGATLLSQDSSGVGGGSEAGDGFGSAVATGDFNGDGRADTAVGVPGEAIGTVAGAGMVNILPGSSAGPTGSGATQVTMDSALVPGGSVAGSHFGAALAAGDVNGDGYDDLIIGAPGGTVDGVAGAGLITVVPGSSSGLQPALATTWSENSTNVPGSAEAGDQFGAAVAAGDVNSDGRADVVVGVPGETSGTTASGQLRFFLGGPSGLTATATAADGVTMGNPGHFGRSVAMGDFNHDGHADVVAGGDGPDGSGAVTVIMGTSAGLTPTAAATLTQDSAGIYGSDLAGDEFGAALASGDVNGDGYADVLAGSPGKTLGTKAAAGDLIVLYGTAAGLSGSGSVGYSQDTAGLGTVSAAGNRMGASVAVLDLNGDRVGDVVIGVSGSGSGAGLVQVLYGSTSKVLTGGNQRVSLATTGAGTGASGDGFGTSLAVG